MCTHADDGVLVRQVYPDELVGIAFAETNDQADRLAIARPTWAVYSTNVDAALRRGLGRHLMVNVLDVDCDSNPWPTIEAFFDSDRPRPNQLAVVVSDRLRPRLRRNGAYSIPSMLPALERYRDSAAIDEHYIEVCQWNLARLAEPHGYTLEQWTAYHCDRRDDATHFAAVLCRRVH